MKVKILILLFIISNTLFANNIFGHWNLSDGYALSLYEDETYVVSSRKSGFILSDGLFSFYNNIISFSNGIFFKVEWIDNNHILLNDLDNGEVLEMDRQKG